MRHASALALGQPFVPNAPFCIDAKSGTINLLPDQVSSIAAHSAWKQGSWLQQSQACGATLHSAACSVFLVFEYCAHDLGRLLDTMPRRFHESEVKCLLKQVQNPPQHWLLQWNSHFMLPTLA